MAKGKRISVERTAARSYLDKAHEFLAAASMSLDVGKRDAVMLNAIHAAIAATDSVTIAFLGVRSTDPDHLRAADLLEEVGGGGIEMKGHGRQLRQLLSQKNVTEYESRRATMREADQAIKRAQRLVDWAREVVSSAKLG
jgi:HEPN domain-containing protein